MSISSVNYTSLISGSRGAKFVSDLEEYIDRSKRGIPALDSTVPGALSEKLSSTSTFLSSQSPRLLEKYSGYLTAFSYDKRGRFVSNLDDSFANLAKITRTA